MKTVTPKELHAALRQFKHNNGNDGFVIGYDFDEVNKAFASQERLIRAEYNSDVKAKHGKKEQFKDY